MFSFKLIFCISPLKVYNLQVEAGDANLTFGALILAESRFKKFSKSFSYLYGSLLYAIPSGKAYSSFEKLFFPFTTKVWLWIGILFVMAAAILILLKLSAKNKRDFLLGKSNNMPFFNMVNIWLGGAVSLSDIPVRNFARTMLMIWLISTLILRNAYQGKLFDNLRSNQRMAPFYFLDELYGSNLKLNLYESFYQNVADNIPEQDKR